MVDIFLFFHLLHLDLVDDAVLIFFFFFFLFIVITEIFFFFWQNPLKSSKTEPLIVQLFFIFTAQTFHN